MVNQIVKIPNYILESIKNTRTTAAAPVKINRFCFLDLFSSSLTRIKRLFKSNLFFDVSNNGLKP